MTYSNREVSPFTKMRRMW